MVKSILLDIKDKKILYELDLNSRQGLACLAKRVGLSQETVRYRVNRLVKEKVIWKYLTVLNLSSLGYNLHKVLIKLQNITNEKRKEIIDYLVNEKDVAWVGSIDGEFDLGFLVMVKNIFTLGEVLSNFYNKYSQFILKKAICANLSGEYYERDYLINKPRPAGKEWPTYSVKAPLLKSIDEYDLKILALLAHNARASAVEIAEEAGISADSVARRIRQMEKDKVIVSYQLLLHNEKIKQMRYKVLLYTHSMTCEKENSIFAFCRLHPRIISAIKTLGPWDLEVDIEAEDVEQFRLIMMELSNKFADVLRDYSALIIYDTHKYNLMPPVF